jgi:hypothetical protein
MVPSDRPEKATRKRPFIGDRAIYAAGERQRAAGKNCPTRDRCGSAQSTTVHECLGLGIGVTGLQSRRRSGRRRRTLQAGTRSRFIDGSPGGRADSPDGHCISHAGRATRDDNRHDRQMRLRRVDRGREHQLDYHNRQGERRGQRSPSASAISHKQRNAGGAGYLQVLVEFECRLAVFEFGNEPATDAGEICEVCWDSRRSLRAWRTIRPRSSSSRRSFPNARIACGISAEAADQAD